MTQTALAPEVSKMTSSPIIFFFCPHQQQIMLQMEANNVVWSSHLIRQGQLGQGVLENGHKRIVSASGCGQTDGLATRGSAVLTIPRHLGVTSPSYIRDSPTIHQWQWQGIAMTSAIEWQSRLKYYNTTRKNRINVYYLVIVWWRHSNCLTWTRPTISSLVALSTWVTAIFSIPGSSFGNLGGGSYSEVLLDRGGGLLQGVFH